MFCPNCGTLNEDQACFCGACGTKLMEQQTPCPQPVVQQKPEQQSYYQVQSWPVQPRWQMPRADKVPGRGLGIAGLVLGVVSVVFGMVWVLSAICGVLAVIFSVAALCKADKAGQSNGTATAGLICGLIGLALALVFGFVGPDALSVPVNPGLDRWVDM